MIVPPETEADSGELLVPVAFDYGEESRREKQEELLFSLSNRGRDDSNSRTLEYLSPSITNPFIDHPPSPPSRSPERGPYNVMHQERGRDDRRRDNGDGTKDVSGKTQELADIVKSQDASSSDKDSGFSNLHAQVPLLWGGDETLPHIDSSSLFPLPYENGHVHDESKRGGLVDDRPYPGFTDRHGNLQSNQNLTSNDVAVEPKRRDLVDDRPYPGLADTHGNLQSNQNLTSNDLAAVKDSTPVSSRPRDAVLRDNTHEHPELRSRDNSLATLQRNVPFADERGQQDSSSMRTQTRERSATADNGIKVPAIAMPDDSSSLLSSEPFMQRISNSVKHSRSVSDKVVRDERLPKLAVNESEEASSPNASSPRSELDRLREEIAWLRMELSKERQRVKERDQRLASMENALNASAEVQQANNELREKRSTMVVLDAQREIILRELGILNSHAGPERRQDPESPRILDLHSIADPVRREFAASINRLEESYAPQIQDLIQQRNNAADDLMNVNRLKDRSLKELEQLSNKNAQLAELNNELVHQIHDLYKANNNASGLGIYSHSKEKSASVDVKPLPNDFGSPTNVSEDMEPATIVPGSQVVSMRRTGQPLKFNWKRGGQKAKGVTKGIKDAFLSSEPKDVNPYTPVTLQDSNSSALSRPQTQHDPSRPGFGLFGNQKSRQGGAVTRVHPDNAATEIPPNGKFIYT